MEDIDTLKHMFEAKLKELKELYNRIKLLEPGSTLLSDSIELIDSIEHQDAECNFYDKAYEIWYKSNNGKYYWESLKSTLKKKFDTRAIEDKVSHDYTCESCKIWLNDIEYDDLEALYADDGPIIYFINKLYEEKISYLPKSWYNNEMVEELRSLLATKSKIKHFENYSLNWTLIGWITIPEYSEYEKHEWDRMKQIISPLNLVPDILQSPDIVCVSWRKCDIDKII